VSRSLVGDVCQELSSLKADAPLPNRGERRAAAMIIEGAHVCERENVDGRRRTSSVDV
jgi:hypothetical protein